MVNEKVRLLSQTVLGGIALFIIVMIISVPFNIFIESFSDVLAIKTNYNNVICSVESPSYIGFMMDNKLEQSKSILGDPASFLTYVEGSNTYYQNFTNGAIYWTLAKPLGNSTEIPLKTIPHEIHGGIYEKWKELGLENSILGYPITDEQDTPFKDGRFSAFEQGAIYSSPSTGVHEIHGGIYEKWKELGLENSILGYPITDVQSFLNGDSISYFEGGLIRWSENDKEAHVLNKNQSYFATLYLSKPTANVTQTRIVDDLYLDIVYKGIDFPTSMTFLAPNDFLILEKNKGTVQRVVNGSMLDSPLLDVNVSTRGERGMLGIVATIIQNPINVEGYHINNDLEKISFAQNNSSTKFNIITSPDYVANTSTNIQKENESLVDNIHKNTTYVFLFFTQTKTKDSSDLCEEVIEEELLGNRLYRYELSDNGTRLINPKLLLELPPMLSPVHNGGKILIGPDNYLYLIVGDLQSYNSTTQNLKNATQTDGTSVVYRLNLEGHPAPKNPFGDDNNNISKFYAYGIRNSFGIDIDPLTGKLWDTENNENNYDEINLVEPGFNSGWIQIQGLMKQNPQFDPQTYLVNKLNNYSKEGKYMDPKFVWNTSAGLAALKFYNADTLGKQYQSDMFVSDVNNENLYRFKLNDNRDDLLLMGPFTDRIADNRKEVEQLAIAHGFGSIIEIQESPDGYLYLASIKEYYPVVNGEGTIYRIMPK